jgi:hypothetical protein
VRTIEGKRHVIVDLRDIYGFQLVYDEAYKTIDDDAWILCDFLHNQYCFKNFSVRQGDVISDAGAYIGDPARYVAQVQISSVLENFVRTMAKDVTDLVLDYLPDQNGKVRVAEYSNVKDSAPAETAGPNRCR